MTRGLAQFLPVEMALLGLFELAVLFVFTYLMLTTTGAAMVLGSTDITRDCLILAAMLAVTIAGTAATIGLYRPDICLDRRRLLISGTIAALLALPAIMLVSGGFHRSLGAAHIVWLASLLAIWLMFVLLVRFVFGLLAPRMPVARRVLVIGDGPRAARLRKRLLSRRHGLFEPVHWSPDLGGDLGGAQSGAARGATGIAALFRHALADRRVWGIVTTGEAAGPSVHEALLDSKFRGIPVYSDATFIERHMGRIDLEAVDTDWLLFADGFRIGPVSRIAKRVVDIVVGLVLMVATLPLMLVTAAMIRLDSPGPVFYRQERTGLDGESFTLFKFRSMAVNAEAAGQPQWARLQDPRVTRVGAFIRASRIDELPQLFNVLRGEMSMIGPRPERPVFVRELAKVIPFYANRGYVKPGLTGWAQVNFPYGASVEDAREKLAYDLYYVKNRGLVFDLLILLSTVRVILFREGSR